MIDKQIDELGNLVLSGATFATVSEDEQIAQAWRIRLQHIKGEWFLDPESGLDIYGRVLRKPFDERSAEREFRRVTMATQGISFIRSITLSTDMAARTLTVNITAVTRNAAAIYFNQEFQL
jgi:hypothetical protein